MTRARPAERGERQSALDYRWRWWWQYAETPYRRAYRRRWIVGREVLTRNKPDRREPLTAGAQTCGIMIYADGQLNGIPAYSRQSSLCVLGYPRPSARLRIARTGSFVFRGWTDVGRVCAPANALSIRGAYA